MVCFDNILVAIYVFMRSFRFTKRAWSTFVFANDLDYPDGQSCCMADSMKFMTILIFLAKDLDRLDGLAC